MTVFCVEIRQFHMMLYVFMFWNFCFVWWCIFCALFGDICILCGDACQFYVVAFVLCGFIPWYWCFVRCCLCLFSAICFLWRYLCFVLWRVFMSWYLTVLCVICFVWWYLGFMWWYICFLYVAILAFCVVRRSDSPSHTNDRVVSELTRVTMVVTVQITPPADLSNPYGATYALWMQLAEEAVSVALLLFIM